MRCRVGKCDGDDAGVELAHEGAEHGGDREPEGARSIPDPFWPFRSTSSAASRDRGRAYLDVAPPISTYCSYGEVR